MAKDLKTMLYRATAGFDARTTESIRATSVAFAAALKTGDAEPRIAEIEKLLTERDAA